MSMSCPLGVKMLLIVIKFLAEVGMERPLLPMSSEGTSQLGGKINNHENRQLLSGEGL